MIKVIEVLLDMTFIGWVRHCNEIQGLYYIYDIDDISFLINYQGHVFNDLVWSVNVFKDNIPEYIGSFNNPDKAISICEDLAGEEFC